jgi:tripartite-type tricarboxylate transporter receptor subunit TctC
MLNFRIVATRCLASPLLTSGVAFGQTYPNKPLRMMTTEVGAAGDFVARMIASGLSDSFGQQLIVDNRGGSGVIPIDIVATAPADGYTLRVFGTAFWLLPFLQPVSYNPVNDFAPVILAVTTPLLLVVHPSLSVKSVKELIAWAKAKPAELNYASGISGSATHLPAELFKSMTGVNLVHVAYKGGGPALNALIGGEVQVMFATSSSAAPQVNAGRLRALAVTSAQPSTLFPDLPSVANSGQSIRFDAVFLNHLRPFCDILPVGFGKLLRRIGDDKSAHTGQPFQ